ncbi:MAG TPA: sigma-54 dependent transcriptional regulator [bacterium]|nr:sigma-54 dependent transcriptional regulator [bacterium]
MKILVVDDNLSMRRLYASYLRDVCELSIASGGREALEYSRKERFDLYITDLIMPGMDGIQFIKKLRTIHPDAGVIVVSQTEEIDLAIGAFRQNPLEFLRKPLKKNLLLNAIQRTVEIRKLRENVKDLRRESTSDPGCPSPVVGESPVMQTFWEKVKRIAEMDLTPAVLVSGESGTGKEVVARQLHRWSRRSAMPFISVNCGLMTGELASSELMGVKKGVATGVEPRKGKFQIANQGTLFLDEIAELPLNIQPMLLRVLQERVVTPVGSTEEIPVDVQVIAATNRDLSQCVSEGRFREDLYYRLNVVQLSIPPLRRHPEDIRPLLEHLYRRHGGRGEMPVKERELALWTRCRWPGNIRQLESALINRMIDDRPMDPETIGVEPARTGSGIMDLNDAMPWSEIKRRIIQFNMDSTGGNIREAARRLGMAKSTLWEYCRRNGINGTE